VLPVFFRRQLRLIITEDAITHITTGAITTPITIMGITTHITIGGTTIGTGPGRVQDTIAIGKRLLRGTALSTV
jgi:hypothetical protein